MIVEQIWTGNALRNFNYLVACGETGEALAIDPLDFNACLSVADARDWRIRQIVNTHEHGDHIGGNKGIIDATGALLIAHHEAGDRIPNVDRGVGAGDVIKNLRCSAATPCSMPARATAITGAIPRSSTTRSSISSMPCLAKPDSIPATTTS